MTRKISKKKIWWIIAAVAVVAVIIVLAVIKGKGNEGIKISTEKAAKRTIIQSVSSNGKIQPEKDIKISPYISGEVVELYVKEGAQVKKGDLLAKIDPEIYISQFDQSEASVNTQKANLSNAKARLAQVKAQFENAKLSFERQEKLFQQNVISKADYDQAKSAFQVAQAQVTAGEEDIRASEYMVKNSEAALKRSREDLTRTAIFAPNDGTVSKLSVLQGERVTGASQFSSGTEIMRIANLNEMEAQVQVNENDIVRVSMGDTALIEVDAYLNRKFKGIVTEIATSANTTGVSVDQVTNFNVKVHILKDFYKDLLEGKPADYSPFRPGMSCTVDIQTETAPNALTVPIQAVTTRVTKDSLEKANQKNTKKKEEQYDQVEFVSTGKKSDNIQECVFILKDGIAKKVNVKTGIQDNANIQILSGLKEGDEIITAPYSAVSKMLKDGDKVKKVEKKDLFTGEKEK
ncbi:MAG TPA: efflux RND transporter periplasmic adaptor subunit [Bacteroidales bacterium]|nr:efflux RND transporter periplasmic adaptor subunit [Bacteroidales bacterium]HPS61425.1 efflux RND transporter periplasmic adaptor subunit [Bacteroidales bacterium]